MARVNYEGITWTVQARPSKMKRLVADVRTLRAGHMIVVHTNGVDPEAVRNNVCALQLKGLRTHIEGRTLEIWRE